MSSPAPGEPLACSTFAPFVGETFDVALDEHGEPITSFILREARENSEAPIGHRKPFSLLFDGPASIELQQQMMWLKHPSLQLSGIFLVPISGDAEKRVYQAVFN